MSEFGQMDKNETGIELYRVDISIDDGVFHGQLLLNHNDFVVIAQRNGEEGKQRRYTWRYTELLDSLIPVGQDCSLFLSLANSDQPLLKFTFSTPLERTMFSRRFQLLKSLYRARTKQRVAILPEEVQQAESNSVDTPDCPLELEERNLSSEDDNMVAYRKNAGYCSALALEAPRIPTPKRILAMNSEEKEKLREEIFNSLQITQPQPQQQQQLVHSSSESTSSFGQKSESSISLNNLTKTLLNKSTVQKHPELKCINKLAAGLSAEDIERAKSKQESVGARRKKHVLDFLKESAESEEERKPYFNNRSWRSNSRQTSRASSRSGSSQSTSPEIEGNKSEAVNASTKSPYSDITKDDIVSVDNLMKLAGRRSSPKSNITSASESKSPVEDMISVENLKKLAKAKEDDIKSEAESGQNVKIPIKVHTGDNESFTLDAEATLKLSIDLSAILKALSVNDKEERLRILQDSIKLDAPLSITFV